MDGTLLGLLGLQAAVLLAALLQAATGIGFGVIAGPVILLALDSGAAVQVTILLSLLIALVLAPTVYRRVDRPLLARYLLGSLAGLPLGILVFLQVSVDVLKLLAGVAVLFMALSASGRFARSPAAGDPRWDGRVDRRVDYGIGLLSGAMSASLAMPGPVAAARLSALARPKDTVRATVLVLFIPSYLAAMAFQAGFAAVQWPTLSLTASLVPATLVGVLLGRLSASRIGERAFRRLIVAVLLATAVSLLGAVAGRQLGLF